LVSASVVTHLNALGTAIFRLANELESTFHCAINAGSQAVVLPLGRIRKLDQSGTRMNLKKISRLVAATLACFLLYRQLAPRDSFAQKVIVITGGSREIRACIGSTTSARAGQARDSCER